MGISTKLGAIPGYLATPAGNGPWPGLVVIHEWWGLDAQTISIAERFAAAGYLAFAPDLYHGELAQLGDGETAMSLVQKYAIGAPAERWIERIEWIERIDRGHPIPRSSRPFVRKKRSRVASSKPASASPNFSNGRRPPSGCG